MKFAFWPFATHYVNSCFPVAHKTTEQANIIADTTVAGANEVAQSAVEGVENAAVASGLVSLVSDETGIYLELSTFCSFSVPAKYNLQKLNVLFTHHICLPSYISGDWLVAGGGGTCV